MACFAYQRAWARHAGACYTSVVRLALALFLGLFFLLPSISGDVPLLLVFEQQYSTAQTLQATFLEKYRDNGRVVQVEAGDAYFLRPGKMRWDYQQPEKNTFVVDGKYVWFYTPTDHTVTRMLTKQSKDWRTPLAFLTTHMKLSRLCSKVAAAPDQQASDPGDSVFRCTLRSAAERAASTKAVLFELTPQGELRRIVIPQDGGIELEFSFAGWKWNPPLGRSVFQFSPPPDAVVVDGVLPDTPGLRQ
jgi:outer membrane lipoprotein carrier protein